VAGEEADFSDEFCRFLQSSVPSVDAAELLLLLAAEPTRSLSAAEVAARLRPATTLSDAEASRYLDELHGAGLLAARPDARPDARFGYAPANPALAAHVDMLALAYKERPVTLFRVIYALRDLKLQSFADAFKLKRK